MKPFLLFIVLMPLHAASVELSPSTNSEMAFALATQQILYTSDTLPEVTVFQTWDKFSECAGTVESCPDSKIYIVVNIGDLYEEPKLYQLPPAKGWEFISSSTNSEFCLLYTSPSPRDA